MEEVGARKKRPQGSVLSRRPVGGKIYDFRSRIFGEEWVADCGGAFRGLGWRSLISAGSVCSRPVDPPAAVG